MQNICYVLVQPSKMTREFKLLVNVDALLPKDCVQGKVQIIHGRPFFHNTCTHTQLHVPRPRAPYTETKKIRHPNPHASKLQTPKQNKRILTARPSARHSTALSPPPGPPSQSSASSPSPSSPRRAARSSPGPRAHRCPRPQTVLAAPSRASGTMAA